MRQEWSETDETLSGEPGAVHLALTNGVNGGRVTCAIDCSGTAAGRATAVRATGRWGRVGLVGEGGEMTIRPSEDLMHDQKTVYGSWVTSTWGMTDLLQLLVAQNLHPELLVTHKFVLSGAAEAHAKWPKVDAGRLRSSSIDRWRSRSGIIRMRNTSSSRDACTSSKVRNNE